MQDHLTRTVEQVSSYDDLLNSILQARLAQVTVDQNNDMRKIRGLGRHRDGVDRRGRHLRHELQAHAGAELALRLSGLLAVLLVVSVLLYRAFRRNGWL